ncbi:MAG: OsmC family protein [Pseudomonadota bacterium]
MTHIAEIVWEASGDVASGAYGRGHAWYFDGGACVAASASPDIVPVPYAQPEAVDPEEAFVASLASCHMLWFLDFARRAGFSAASYRDHAVGHMERAADGGLWIARVDLRPRVDWEGASPSSEEENALHHEAHGACFIARSVRTKIAIEVVRDMEEFEQ